VIHTSFVENEDTYPMDQFDSICEMLRVNPSYLVASALNWASPSSTDIMYVHERSPNSVLWDCFLRSSSEHRYKITITARSFHPGMVHAAMLDGSVRPISNQIEIRLWSSLGSVDDADTATID
jgi:prepilin-type processing-associated H-X9-DG protein